ncbi:MAG: hypothetical protein ACXITV_02810 [Luteibaculaceae bacterium]
MIRINYICALTILILLISSAKLFSQEDKHSYFGKKVSLNIGSSFTPIASDRSNDGDLPVKIIPQFGITYLKSKNVQYLFAFERFNFNNPRTIFYRLNEFEESNPYFSGTVAGNYFGFTKKRYHPNSYAPIGRFVFYHLGAGLLNAPFEINEGSENRLTNKEVGPANTGIFYQTMRVGFGREYLISKGITLFWQADIGISMINFDIIRGLGSILPGDFYGGNPNLNRDEISDDFIRYYNISQLNRVNLINLRIGINIFP